MTSPLGPQPWAAEVFFFSNSVDQWGRERRQECFLGDWKHFVQYVAVLNWFVPKALIPALSVLETAIEIMLGVALLLGIWHASLPGVVLVCCFHLSLTMSVALGVVAPLSYSAFTAIGAAFLLGAIAFPASGGLSAADSTSRKEKSPA